MHNPLPGCAVELHLQPFRFSPSTQRESLALAHGSPSLPPVLTFVAPARFAPFSHTLPACLLLHRNAHCLLALPFATILPTRHPFTRKPHTLAVRSRLFARPESWHARLPPFCFQKQRFLSRQATWTRGRMNQRNPIGMPHLSSCVIRAFHSIISGYTSQLP